VRFTSILTTEDIPSMPHHIATMQGASLVMPRQTVKVEVYIREVIAYKPFPRCWFWQRRNLVRCAANDACEQENSKFGSTNNTATYPEVMSRNVRDYPWLFSPNRTACNRNRCFPQKREW